MDEEDEVPDIEENEVSENEILTKRCYKCKEKKEVSFMVKCNRTTDGYSTICKQCKSNHYEQNKTEILKKQEIYRSTHKQEIAARDKKYAENNKDKIQKYRADYYEQNRDATRVKSKEYYQSNREKCIRRGIEWKRERLKEDPIFRLECNLRSRVKNAIKFDAGEKAEGTFKLLGCTIQQVRTFLEAEFEPGMSWDNYGEWHVDHIRPCASFNLEDPEEQKKCFHWTNLQPLWALDNILKGARYEPAKEQT
jgi:hypothetical protein